MDRQYEYAFVSPCGHYGFLPYDPIKYGDPLAEKRMNTGLGIPPASPVPC
jgi:hypothetical protein